MTYATGQALALDQVKELLAFNDLNTSEGDWVIINKGYGVCAILHPGPFEHEQHGGAGSYVTNWTTFIDVWVTLTKYAEAQATLISVRDKLIDRFRKYRKMGDITGSILDASITSGNEVLQIVPDGGGAAYLKQTLNLQWQEVKIVTLAE